MLNNLRKRIANIISPSKNSMSLPNQYLKYGSKIMQPEWTQVSMSDQDLYTGYAYAAIRKRANATARIALEYIKTESKKKDFNHPYLDIISKSPTFSDYEFWRNISTYLDLEGIFYLMAIRAYDGGRFGDIKEFKLLNPYKVKRVVRKTEGGSLEVGGYIETAKGGYMREIPKEMIIEMRELNPFDADEPYAMTDAAKESQFTIKTAGDYTRHTLKHNINAPGIMTTDVILPDPDFENFMARVRSHTKGEPLFGNGKGAIDWKDMNIDLSKSDMKNVTELNRDVLFAVTGMSKTTMGIEQSGTTRETSKVQKDLLAEGEILPQIQTIIDPLNQDYKNNYPKEYAVTNAIIKVENPNSSDHEAEAKAIEAKQKNADLYNGLIDKGYDPTIAASYVMGNIEIDQLGVPKKPKEAAPAIKEHIHSDDCSCGQKKNDIGDATTQQEGALQNAIVNIDASLVSDVITRIQKNAINAYEDESDLITKTQKKDYEKELMAILVGFYGIVMMLNGKKAVSKRQNEYGLTATFMLDAIAKRYIQDTSRKVAESHIQTVLDDILVAARQAALDGADQRGIINAIRNKYDATISENRAKTIARTETNRAFTRSQYEADRQFIKQNKLEKRAYKRFRTRSSNPCAFCESLSKGPLIPFNGKFADLGDDITAGGKTISVSFEAIEAGNVHPNCSCEYELVILSE